MKQQPTGNSRDQSLCRIFRRILHWLELLIAGITILILVISLVLEICQMVTVPDYFQDFETFLHYMLNMVVGLEFVRMLIDMTPATTLEVLILATARHIILNHNQDFTLLIGILCVAILFAVRRFLIPREELTREMVEPE